MRLLLQVLTPFLLGLSLAGCYERASLPVEAGTGPSPQLPPPRSSMIPTLDIAPAKGWPEGATPVAAPGLKVTSFAANLDHPRWIYVLPNGDVLVAETNAPERPNQGQGLRGWVQKKAMKRAGAATPSANRITLLRDVNGDGEVDLHAIFLKDLNSPLGMALVGKNFYVANTDGIVRYAYEEGQTQITTPGTPVVALPAGPRNHHWTKNIIANADGTRLYATAGSNSNAGENGMEEEQGRAAIWEVDPQLGKARLFATGLRNPNGMGWEPESNALWTTVNERDEIGSDLVPDYMTSVKDGGFYGWPYSYFGQHVDERVKPPNPERVASALKPDYALGPHTASLGLTFSKSGVLPPRYANGVFIGQHGSWNRRPLSGYKVIFIPFTGGRPSNPPVDILTGFIDDDGHARGRPVGVAMDRVGGLLIADDVGNRIWRVTGQGAP